MARKDPFLQGLGVNSWQPNRVNLGAAIGSNNTSATGTGNLGGDNGGGLSPGGSTSLSIRSYKTKDGFKVPDYGKQSRKSVLAANRKDYMNRGNSIGGSETEASKAGKLFETKNRYRGESPKRTYKHKEKDSNLISSELKDARESYIIGESIKNKSKPRSMMKLRAKVRNDFRNRNEFLNNK